MPYDDPALGPAEIRKIWKGKPDLVKALLEAREAGWRIVPEGKHYRAFCPCEARATFSVAGTPKSPSAAARRVRRDASRCPACHDLLTERSAAKPRRPA